MTIDASISFLIAVGAILKFAVTATVADVDIQVGGLILMIAGGFELLIGLFMEANRRRDVRSRATAPMLNRPVKAWCEGTPLSGRRGPTSQTVHRSTRPDGSPPGGR